MDTGAFILSGLNAAQQQAVTAPLGQLLVLAGAGSGKTRVLTHRIAWLVQQGAATHQILAVTFTNKAANEIRHRLQQLLQYPIMGMWVGTFHGIALRILRQHGHLMGLPPTFQVIDSDDQLRLLRHILVDLQIDDKTLTAQQAQHFINARKEEGLRAHHIERNLRNQTALQAYWAYQGACQRAALLDFAELLLAVHELWQAQPLLLENYQRQFRHILVDEFQDTNTIQYAWIRLLAQNQPDILVVGDDDQAIYRWRGAKVENLQDFKRDFAHAKLLRLEQNYRSTATILNAANTVIANNVGRLGKELWTQAELGDKIQLYEAFNDQEEARFVVEKIQAYLRQGYRPSQVAILYRVNALSRQFEAYLLAAKIAYRIYGGLRFFDRSEIKDALAYLRLIQHPGDDAAFLRVINVPTRGIGERSLEKIRYYAQQNQCSLWQAAAQLVTTRDLPKAALEGIRAFQQLVLRYQQQLPLLDARQLGFARWIAQLLAESQIMQFYQKDAVELRQSRQDNLQELVHAAHQFETQAANEGDEEAPQEWPLLMRWLSGIALDAVYMEAANAEEAVQLMTIHAAKGLEFPVVFMVGMEEQGFPLARATQDLAELEEERRLCYVGITRAQKHLMLSWASKRYQYQDEVRRSPSRFIAELPPEALHFSHRGNLSGLCAMPGRLGRQSVMAASSAGSKHPYTVGQRVNHAHFGPGRVLAFDGRDEHTRVQVKFERVGDKWLVMSYANLQAI